jgi:hypothetical protein
MGAAHPAAILLRSVLTRGAVTIRILVALEDDYRVYRETIAVGIRILRPQAETKSVELEALEEEIKRFAPQVVIYSGHETVDSSDSLAWIELSVDPTSSTKITVGGCCIERTNPTLKELLELIDRVVRPTTADCSDVGLTTPLD